MGVGTVFIASAGPHNPRWMNPPTEQVAWIFVLSSHQVRGCRSSAGIMGSRGRDKIRSLRRGLFSAQNVELHPCSFIEWKGISLGIYRPKTPHES
jgi:hypothetical protein